MWRWVACVVLLALLTGCREVRVKTEAHGTTAMPGGNQIIVVQYGGRIIGSTTYHQMQARLKR